MFTMLATTVALAAAPVGPVGFLPAPDKGCGWFKVEGEDRCVDPVAVRFISDLGEFEEDVMLSSVYSNEKGLKSTYLGVIRLPEEAPYPFLPVYGNLIQSIGLLQNMMPIRQEDGSFETSPYVFNNGNCWIYDGPMIEKHVSESILNNPATAIEEGLLVPKDGSYTLGQIDGEEDISIQFIFGVQEEPEEPCRTDVLVRCYRVEISN